MNLLPGPHRHLEDSSLRYSGAQRGAVKKQYRGVGSIKRVTVEAEFSEGKDSKYQHNQAGFRVFEAFPRILRSY